MSSRHPSIHLISGPRNISTAMMYSFGCRPDVQAIDEPFYAYYLSYFDVPKHPAEQAVLQSQSNDPTEVLRLLHHASQQSPIFIKNMAHHLRDLDWAWLSDMKNVFLIRDVGRLIKSFSKVITDVTLDDIGIKQEYEIWRWCKRNDVPTLVVDANQVLTNPGSVLAQICKFAEIPFDPTMLKWPAGPKIFDGCWALHWYTSVHRSTSFGPPYTDTVTVPSGYQDLYEAALPYYQLLLNETIEPDATDF